MPLVSAGVWFHSDAGDGLPVPTRPRPRFEPPYFPLGTDTGSVDQKSAAQQPDSAYHRGGKRFQATETHSGQWIVQPVIDAVNKPFIDNYTPPLRRPPRQPAAVEGLVPIWTWGTGQPVPPLAWGQDDGALRKARVTFRAPQDHLPPLQGVSDIPFTLIGWRDDPAPMRWRRPAFRAQEMTALPPQAVFVETVRYYAALIAPQADLVRARRWTAATPDADASAIYQGVAITTDHLGWVDWDVPQPRIVYRQQRAWSDPGAWPVLDTTIQPVPWLPTDTGDRQAARQPWRGNVTQHTEPLWQGAGLISIPGPYQLIAAQLWQPGAVDAQIESPN